VDVETVITGLERFGRAELARVEVALKRRQRELEAKESVGGTPVSDVLEYRPHADGYLQLEVRRYFRTDRSVKEHGPYWYFRYHEGGKQKTLYLGKTDDPEGVLERKRATSSTKVR